MAKELVDSKYEFAAPEGYAFSPAVFFKEKNLPAVGKYLIEAMEKSIEDIERKLAASPSVINAISSCIPKEVLQVVFTDEQKAKLESGALKLMTKKDGSLMANLIDSKTGKLVSTTKIEKVRVPSDCSQAMAGLAMQMQLTQMAEQIQLVQKAVEEVRVGQENDRLAIAYSCQQRFIQAMNISNIELRRQLLLSILADAETSRNQLMMSQKNNLDLLFSQAPGTLKKALSVTTSVSENDRRLSEIRNGLCAVNIVSLVEAMAYQELGEGDAARTSLKYYEEFLLNTYLSDPKIVERLDSLDPSTTRYWKNTVPRIRATVAALPETCDVLFIGGGD